MSLFEPIQQLKLSDTFYDWWQTTNEISSALNPLNIYDVAAGPGISVTRITDGIAVLSVNVGCGLRHDANVSLTLDIQNLPEKSTPDEGDNYIIELADSTNITPESTDCETFRRVEATNILPYTVSGDHNFIGGTSSAITISSTNFTVESTNTHFKDNSIKLGNVASTARSAISSVGFFIDALDEDPSWIYRGDLLAWYTNQNIGISYDQAFVSEGPSGSTTAKFNFSPKGATQSNTELNLLLGTRTTEIVTTDTDEAITLRAIDSTNAFDVSYITTAGARTPLFYGKYDSGGGYVLFNIGGRIYIEDIQNSTQFLTSSDYSEYKVPLTNTNGILDYKFTNRYVSSLYDVSISVGDAVRFNGTQFVKAQANTEANSQVFGVVERISGGKIWVAVTGLVLTSGLTSGSVHYLSQSTAGQLTTTKPTTGIVKPVILALSTTTGLISPSASASSPYFSNVEIEGGATIDADSVGDTLTLIPGDNITITKNTNNEIIIAAASLSQADYFKYIDADFGFITASGEDTLTITGQNGITTLTTSGNTLFLNGANCYSRVQVLGMNTGELDYGAEAMVSGDTLYLRSGTGISITSDSNNDILIEATGVSVPAEGSVTNSILANMHSYSIKAAQGDGEPVDVFDTSVPGLYAGGYIVTGGSGPLDPVIYTEDKVGGLSFTSISSISGDTLLATAPNEDIAGYVFGRWTDETGNVSDIIPLGRTELRSILGASPTGFLEENSNVFNAWFLYESDQETEISQVTASSKTGHLNFVAGNNITLSRAVAVGPNNELAIRIDAASSLSGFNSIINNRNGHNIQSGDTGGVLEITDLDAIAVDVDSNNGLSFSIKPESITNEMLANMPFNSVKVSVHDTDNPNPIDLQIGTNEVLGRTSGVLKSLNSTELKEILGLTSSFYFKSISLQDESGVAVPNSTVAASSGSEAFILRSGTNISISKITGQNGYQIDSLSGTSGGLTKIIVTDVGIDNLTVDNPATLQFGLTNLTYPSGFGATGNYTNIDYIPTTSTGTIVNSIDLAPMPQFSVKVASNTTTTRHGAPAFLASNLVLGANQILCRPTGSSSLVGKTIQEIAADTNGLSYFRTISDGTSNTVITGNGPHILALVPGPRISITPAYNAGAGTAQFTITSQTVLSSDAAPTLGANLNVSNFNITKVSANVLAFNATLGDTRFVTVASSASTTGTPSLSSTTSETGTFNIDFGINPLRGGALAIGGTSPTIKSGIANSTFGISATSTSTTAKHITLESGLGTLVTIGTTSVAKHLALQVASNAHDIRISGPSNTNYCAFRIDSSGNTGIITNNTSGNLILVSGSATVGTIPTSGSTSVQFNSDILLSAKSIKAVDNNITVDTVTNDFTGSLKLKATSKSGFHRVKNGQRVNGTASTKILETISTTSNTEKFGKYMLYMQDTLSPTSCAVVEFNVLANGSARSLQTVSVMVSDVTGDFANAFNGSSEYEIVLLSSVSATITGNPGQTITGPQLTLVCNTNNPTEGANTFLVQFNNCLLRDYNYTLYKMSIEA